MAINLKQFQTGACHLIVFDTCYVTFFRILEFENKSKIPIITVVLSIRDFGIQIAKHNNFVCGFGTFAVIVHLPF